jgi:hypothetical protein
LRKKDQDEQIARKLILFRTLGFQAAGWAILVSGLALAAAGLWSISGVR